MNKLILKKLFLLSIIAAFSVQSISASAGFSTSCCYENPLKTAIVDGDLEEVKQLVEKEHYCPSCYEKDCDSFDQDQEEEEDFDQDLQEEEDECVCPIYKDDYPIIDASFYGHLEIVKYLVEEQGVDIDEENHTGKTTLHVAIEQGKPEIVQYLLENGAQLTYEIIKLAEDKIVEKRKLTENETVQIEEAEANEISEMLKKYNPIESRFEIMEESTQQVNVSTHGSKVYKAAKSFLFTL